MNPGAQGLSQFLDDGEPEPTAGNIVIVQAAEALEDPSPVRDGKISAPAPGVHSKGRACG